MRTTVWERGASGGQDGGLRWRVDAGKLGANAGEMEVSRAEASRAEICAEWWERMGRWTAGDEVRLAGPSGRFPRSSWGRSSASSSGYSSSSSSSTHTRTHAHKHAHTGPTDPTYPLSLHNCKRPARKGGEATGLPPRRHNESAAARRGSGKQELQALLFFPGPD